MAKRIVRFCGACWFVLAAAPGCTTSNPLANASDTEAAGTQTGGESSGTTSAMTSGAGDPSDSGPGEAETTASTSGEATGSGSGDTSDPVCGSTCVSPIPPGWSGPGAVLTTSHDDAPPTCPEAYPEVATEVGTGLIAPDAPCDCDCADPTALTCAGTRVRNFGGNASCVVVPTTVVLASNPNSCTMAGDFDGDDYYRFNAGEVTGGNCQAIDSSGAPAEPFFSNRVTLCGGARTSSSGCEDDQLCVPDPGAGASYIWQAGNLQCPEATGWSERSLYSSDWEDSRGCTACGCGDPTGTCPGRVSLLGSGICDPGGQGAGGFVTDGSCVRGLNSGLTVDGLRWSPDPIVAECSSTGGEPMGEAVATDPVTVCCRPE